MKISVVIATYQRPDYLRRCLESLWNQTRKPDEIVLVIRPEDKSTQESITSFQEETKSEIPLTVAFVEKPGVVFAENEGIRHATGDILCFIDDDATAPSNWLGRIERHFKDPTVGTVGGPVLPAHEGVQPLPPGARWGHVSWWGKFSGNSQKVPGEILEVDALRGCNMAFRRELLPHFDEHLKGYWRFEDDAVLSVKEKGFRALCDPQIQVTHYLAPVQVEYKREIDPLSIFSSNHNNTYVVLKHFPLMQKVAFLCFTFLVGDISNPGMFRYLFRTIKRGRVSLIRQELLPALKGKIEGIQTYRKNHAKNKRPPFLKCPLCSSLQVMLHFASSGAIDLPSCIFRCLNCHIVFAERREMEGSLYEESYAYHQKAHEPLDTLRTQEHLQTLMKQKRGRLLDVGCSRGHFLNGLKREGWEVEGIEVSKEAVSQAEKEFGLKIFQGKLEDAPFPENSFDVVTCWDVLEHVPEPVPFLKKCRSLLKGGGILFIDTPNVESLYACLIGRKWVGFNRYHLFYYSPETLRDILRKVGFEEIGIRTTHVNLFSKEGLWRMGFYPSLARFRDFLRRKRSEKNGSRVVEIPKKPWRMGVLGICVNTLPNWILGRLLLGDQLFVMAKKGRSDEGLSA
ncbi:MAG: methyltransferase domain-containing protein [Candidatus Omnitrophica bacterium]|nr:methyltransferase domain-containing protein [Candidatus Omnitrophota bacterium]